MVTLLLFLRGAAFKRLSTTLSPLPGINLGPTTSVHPMYCACTNGEQLLQVYYDNVCIMPFNALPTHKNFRTDVDNLV